MWKAIGLLISLYAISLFFSNSMNAFDRAATESFKVVEAAAVLSQQQISAIEIIEK